MGAGSAPFLLLEPSSVDELFEVIRFLSAHSIPVFCLGGGTNTIGSDTPLPGVVLRLRGTFCRIEGTGPDFEAGSGALLSALIDHACGHSYGGAAGLSGIPGSVGGALRMNAGANGLEIGRFVRSVRGIDRSTGAWMTLNPVGTWGYRTSPVPENMLITSAVFEFEKRDFALEREQILSERRRRASVTPPGRSGGSVFRNPSPGLSAGFLLDRAGCKGLCSPEGGARVSERHANWIVAGRGGCMESEIVDLVVKMASRVKAADGIVLNTELKFMNMESKKRVETSFRPLNILVLKGGTSAEREISLISGGAVAAALREAGHRVEEFDITELKVTDAMRRADVIYPVLHGGFGEDGELQEMLEKAGLKFVGSGSAACRDIMDKIISKRIMDAHGIRNAASVIAEDMNAPFPSSLGLPLIVKPPLEGSTFGLSLVTEESEWKPALALSFKHGSPALAEAFIDGVEGTVGILDGEALPMIEIRYPGKIYDYDAKYTHAKGETLYLCPPHGISAAAQAEARDLALKFYHAIGARDMLRVDVIVSRKDDTVWVLEGNALPGCTPSSLLPKAAGIAGITFPAMCSRLALAAWMRP